jgi:sarcosine oxidase subunit delta
MLLIHCPYCGEERPELEFRQAGEAHIARPADINGASDADFETFLFLRTNTKGLVYERWRHVHGCGRFFNAVRDSVTDRFFTTYKAGLPKPDPARFAKAVAAVEPLVAEQATPMITAQPKPAAPARPPRKTATPPAVETSPEAVAAAEPAPAAETANKPARRARATAVPEAASAAAEAKPKRKAPKAQATPETPAKAAPRARKTAAADGGEAPAAAGVPAQPDDVAKPKPAPKRTRSSPVKKGEA